MIKLPQYVVNQLNKHKKELLGSEYASNIVSASITGYSPNDKKVFISLNLENAWLVPKVFSEELAEDLLNSQDN